jgi:hypothetical protein
MKGRVDLERSHDFKRTFLLAACLALFLALLFLGFYYGCAKSSRPERPTNSPPASGMSAVLASDARSMVTPQPRTSQLFAPRTPLTANLKLLV